MRQSGSCFIGKEERSKMRQKWVKNAYFLKCVKNTRNSFGGEHLFREKQRGWKKLRGGENIPLKPLPKNGFGPPPPMIRFPPPPPPFAFALLFSLEETGTDQANPTFWGLQNWLWRAHSMVRFPPPPPKSHDTFCPPISRFPTSWTIPIGVEICTFEGGGIGGREALRPRTLFFVRNATTIKFWKCNYIDCR